MKPNGTGPHGRQDYGTPAKLLDAVRSRFGNLHYDLAARVDNSVARDFISPEQDSLCPSTDWPGYDIHSPFGTAPVNLWLNPPFAGIGPWAEKCTRWMHGMVHPMSRLFLLVPASVGANWWTMHVSGQAHVIALSPRLTFVGCKDPYPKDCALCVYEPAWPNQPRTVEPWKWNADTTSNLA